MKLFLRYNEFINELNLTGFEKGSIQLSEINVDDAITYCFTKDIDILNIIPEFKNNFNILKNLVSYGKTVRKDMPRLNRADILFLQTKLKKGELDINKPFAKTTNIKNPWPEGLTGKDAEEFLIAGLKDGELKDDIIKTVEVDIVLNKLKPIQKEIYFDQLIDFFINHKTIENILKEIHKRYFLISADNNILDGHHRFGIGMLINPTLKVSGIKIHLELKKLLPLTVAFGDVLGNERNK